MQHNESDITNVLHETDKLRKKANRSLESSQKSNLGQYMTPASVAFFMASMFTESDSSDVRLLDPGAGIGSLTSALVHQLTNAHEALNISVDTYEIDAIMISYLEETLQRCKQDASAKECAFSWKIIDSDFISEASNLISSLDSFWPEKIPGYTHCIMNPPYKKLASSSKHRRLLRTVGIETVNLYSAFVALAILLLQKGGELVAIIPRSFCNGPYYRPFREFILKRTEIKHIHLFDSRTKAFKDDQVLQENIIIYLEVGGEQGDVKITTSTDDSFSDLKSAIYAFNQIVKADDAEAIIHIPTSEEPDQINESEKIVFSLKDIGLEVSTGPVVDFRLKPHLRQMPEEDTVPLLYPMHFNGQDIHWPIPDGKKPNAIMNNDKTLRWLYPNGYYTVVRRFSSKEEKRRIVARVIDPDSFPNYEWLGIENHLNVFHKGKQSLDPLLAKGLSIFLNSAAVDSHFRRFSGHTQVNATDLRFMKYPSRKSLIELGKWTEKQKQLSQEIIDEHIEKVVL